MTYEYSDTFERLSNQICSSCRASDGECACLDYHTCPFWSEFEDLLKLCVKVDSLADDILHNTCTFEPEPAEFATAPGMTWL